MLKLMGLDQAEMAGAGAGAREAMTDDRDVLLLLTIVVVRIGAPASEKLSYMKIILDLILILWYNICLVRISAHKGS